jgi:WD40 repeat protein
MRIIRAPGPSINALAFAPDGRTLASAVYPVVRLHDLAAGTILQEWIGSPNHCPVAFTSDGQRLVYGASGGNCIFVRPIQGGGRAIRIPSRFHGFSLDPHRDVVATFGQVVQEWSLSTGQPLPDRTIEPYDRPGGKLLSIQGFTFSADGRRAAIALGRVQQKRWKTRIVFLDAVTGTLGIGAEIEFRYELPRTLTFSPDGRRLVGLCGPVLRVWDADTANEISPQQSGRRHLQDLAFTPNGRRLITVSNDKTASIWDTSTWAVVGGYEWKVGNLRSVAVSPDGLLVAAGGDSGKIVVWDNDD